MTNTKNCNKCKQDKTEADFSKRGNGLMPYCKPCKSTLAKEWRDANPDRYKTYHKGRGSANSRLRIKRLYGLDYDTYAAMIKDGCAVCGTHERLCVDHDHSCCEGEKSCGKCVRGILCSRHNRILGLLNDSPAEIQGLKDYIDLAGG